MAIQFDNGTSRAYIPVLFPEPREFVLVMHDHIVVLVTMQEVQGMQSNVKPEEVEGIEILHGFDIFGLALVRVPLRYIKSVMP